MPDETRKRPRRVIRSSRPGDRVLLVRTRKPRLASIGRETVGAVAAALALFRDVFTQTLVLPVIAFLALLVIIVPVPIFLIERTSNEADVTSYWIGLWWAFAAFTTVGHSDVGLVTSPGRVLGAIFTVVSVALFFGSVIAAFSSYFLLTWRKPKRQVIDTITYYLQRIEQLSVDEIDELEEITGGVLHSARERAVARHEEESPDEDAP
ncbi:MAG: two pore domain potassium channel family protein [Chloroflexi bacterium]|nr:two pore domain potassium channel family protein [Chloroflexota bacterium]